MNFHPNGQLSPEGQRSQVRRTGLLNADISEDRPASGGSKRLYFVEQGPECLFVSIKDGRASHDDFQGLCEELWTLLQRHLVKRLFLDLTNVDCLSSLLIGQLISLKIRLEKRDGMLCLCGLSTRNQHVLAIHNLESRLPNYPSRYDAIMGNSNH
jgi:anti-anti-sigma regulatory factor